MRGYEKILRCSMLLFLLLFHSRVIGGQPLLVILDTDINTDNDDVTAVAMLHPMADIGSRLSETPAHNPARIAFEAYNQGAGKGKCCSNRHCADPSTVLYAVYDTCYFGEVGPGACDVRAGDAFTRWDSKTDKQHFYSTQKLPISELERIMENLLIKSPKSASHTLNSDSN